MLKSPLKLMVHHQQILSVLNHQIFPSPYSGEGRLFLRKTPSLTPTALSSHRFFSPHSYCKAWVQKMSLLLTAIFRPSFSLYKHTHTHTHTASLKVMPHTRASITPPYWSHLKVFRLLLFVSLSLPLTAPTQLDDFGIHIDDTSRTFISQSQSSHLHLLCSPNLCLPSLGSCHYHLLNPSIVCMLNIPPNSLSNFFPLYCNGTDS